MDKKDKKTSLLIRCSTDVGKRFKHLSVEIGGYSETLKALLDVYEHYAKLYNTYNPRELKTLLQIEL